MLSLMGVCSFDFLMLSCAEKRDLFYKTQRCMTLVALIVSVCDGWSIEERWWKMDSSFIHYKLPRLIDNFSLSLLCQFVNNNIQTLSWYAWTPLLSYTPFIGNLLASLNFFPINWIYSSLSSSSTQFQVTISIISLIVLSS